MEATRKRKMAADDGLDYDLMESDLILKLSWDIIRNNAGFKNGEEVVKIAVFVNSCFINSTWVPVVFGEEFHRRAQDDVLRAFEWLDDPLLQVQMLRSLIPARARVEVKGSAKPTRWCPDGNLTVTFSFNRSDRRM